MEIPKKNKSSDLSQVHERWIKYNLPENMDGLSFLDVGCWSGGMCVEAVKRGSKQVLGVDMVKNSILENYSNEYNFDFLYCDVFSEKFLEIPTFDIVFCKGVLYHVEDPMSLLIRLKTKVQQSLILETAIVNNDIGKPILQLFPGNEFDGNYSNWWFPNPLCVEKMLECCEFSNIQCVLQTESRVMFRATPQNKICRKILPRSDELM